MRLKVYFNLTSAGNEAATKFSKNVNVPLSLVFHPHGGTIQKHHVSSNKIQTIFQVLLGISPWTVCKKLHRKTGLQVHK